jgi:hypothetical protein
LAAVCGAGLFTAGAAKAEEYIVVVKDAGKLNSFAQLVPFGVDRVDASSRTSS